MKSVEVVAAVIRNGEKFFATQRGYGEFKDYWEFPGGKVEPGESLEEALRREIMEELGAEILVGERLAAVEYDYPRFHLVLHCFICSLGEGDIELREHEAARWLAPDELGSIRWLPADLAVVGKLSRLA